MRGIPDPPAVHALEERIVRVLRAGVWLSSISLACGLALALAVPGIAAAHWLLTAGLIILLATPASRVLVSVVSYGRSRDWLFAVLTLIVLLELAGSVVAAWHGRSLE